MLLFRVYNDQSGGVNTPTLFTPVAATSLPQPRTYQPPTISKSAMAIHLKDAFEWNSNNSISFVFYTNSLLFAIAVAQFKTAKGPVKITCFDTAKAATPKGGKVEFIPAMEMIRKYNVPFESPREYADVYIAMGCVVPGQDARTASFKEIEEKGLYQLYPAMQGNAMRRNSRFALALDSWRRFHFQRERKLTLGWMDQAAKVASAFRGLGKSEKVDAKVLAHFIGLQKVNTRDPVLREWMGKNSIIDLDAVNGDEVFDCGGLPELVQYQKLSEVFKGVVIEDRALNSNDNISQKELRSARIEWEIWRRDDIDEHREARENRPDFDPDRRIRSRRGQRSNDNGRSMKGGYGHEQRTRQKSWIPGEEYRARRDAARAARHSGRSRPAIERVRSSVAVPSKVSKGHRYHNDRRHGNGQRHTALPRVA